VGGQLAQPLPRRTDRLGAGRRARRDGHRHSPHRSSDDGGALDRSVAACAFRAKQH
jgi:hypothetical protein